MSTKSRSIRLILLVTFSGCLFGTVLNNFFSAMLSRDTVIGKLFESQTVTIIPENSIAGEKHSDMGGLKEWTTDQEADEDGKLDEAAQKAADKAKKSNICIPIGEGENCW